MGYLEEFGVGWCGCGAEEVLGLWMEGCGVWVCGCVGLWGWGVVGLWGCGVSGCGAWGGEGCAWGVGV